MKHAPQDMGWRRLFMTREGKFVIGQKPNLPAWLWIGATAAAYIFEPLTHILMGIAYGSGLVWAYLEMKCGVNTFRRILGGVVLFAITLIVAGRIITG